MPDVVRVHDIAWEDILDLTARYSICIERLALNADLQQSYWGAPEAGISHTGVTVRNDTPLHSLLHELCHVVCMSSRRRAQFECDAAGSDAEECGVCYLQILLADQLRGYSGVRCLADMDAWGYSFREGSARAWFEGDGREARDWLLAHELIDEASQPTWRLRS